MLPGAGGRVTYPVAIPVGDVGEEEAKKTETIIRDNILAEFPHAVIEKVQINNNSDESHPFIIRQGGAAGQYVTSAYLIREGEKIEVSRVAKGSEEWCQTINSKITTYNKIAEDHLKNFQKQQPEAFPTTPEVREVDLPIVPITPDQIALHILEKLMPINASVWIGKHERGGPPAVFLAVPDSGYSLGESLALACGTADDLFYPQKVKEIQKGWVKNEIAAAADISFEEPGEGYVEAQIIKFEGDFMGYQAWPLIKELVGRMHTAIQNFNQNLEKVPGIFLVKKGGEAYIPYGPSSEEKTGALDVYKKYPISTNIQLVGTSTVSMELTNILLEEAIKIQDKFLEENVCWHMGYDTVSGELTLSRAFPGSPEAQGFIKLLQHHGFDVQGVRTKESLGGGDRSLGFAL